MKKNKNKKTKKKEKNMRPRKKEKQGAHTNFEISCYITKRKQRIKANSSRLST